MIKVNEIFCSEMLKELKATLTNDYIDEKRLKEHIDSCEICKQGISVFSKNIFTKFSPIQLMSLLKK